MYIDKSALSADSTSRYSVTNRYRKVAACSPGYVGIGGKAGFGYAFGNPHILGPGYGVGIPCAFRNVGEGSTFADFGESAKRYRVVTSIARVVVPLGANR